MSRPTLRHAILTRSVQRLVGDGEQVRDVVMLFTRHRWFLPYSLFAGLALFLVASTTGIDGTLNRVVLAGCGVAIAAMATTNHWVLAETDRGLVLLRSSRIRQYAQAIVTRFPRNEPLDMVGSTVITSDWRVDGTMYTLTKRWEPAMRRIAMAP